MGANVGAYNFLAGAVAGARDHAFEPIPKTFIPLLDNIRLNCLTERVHAMNAGVAAVPGVLRFTSAFDSGNHVAPSGADAHGAKPIEVPVVPLDSLDARANPTLIKIDVEGYETPVIQEAARLLESSSLLAVIMELNGSGARYGFDEWALHRQMIDRGFQWCTYAPAERAVRETPENSAFGLNNLYVRDIQRLQERVRTGPSFRVLGMEF